MATKNSLKEERTEQLLQQQNVFLEQQQQFLQICAQQMEQQKQQQQQQQQLNETLTKLGETLGQFASNTNRVHKRRKTDTVSLSKILRDVIVAGWGEAKYFHIQWNAQTFVEAVKKVLDDKKLHLDETEGTLEELAPSCFSNFFRLKLNQFRSTEIGKCFKEIIKELQLDCPSLFSTESKSKKPLMEDELCNWQSQLVLAGDKFVNFVQQKESSFWTWVGTLLLLGVRPALNEQYGWELYSTILEEENDYLQNKLAEVQTKMENI